MTWAWAAVGMAALAVRVQTGAPPAVFDDGLIHITSARTVPNLERGTVSFLGGVRVRYGPSTITAEEVVADQRQKTARASGNVVLTDPEGTVQATDLTLNWNEGTRRATAQNVRIEVSGARLRARTAELTDTLWVFTDIEGTTCRENSPLYYIRSPRLEVVPGRSGKVVKPRLSLFGRQIITLPTQRFNLDRRVQGIRPPNVVYRRQQGLGIAWNGQFLVDTHTAAGFDFGSFRGGYPNLGLSAARSYVDPDRATTLITPRDDLGDRFNVGYFDSIELGSPQTGFGYLGQPRSTVAVASQFNRGAVIGPPGLSYSKPLDLSYEASGKRDKTAALGQLRAQAIRTQFSSVVTRLNLAGTGLTDAVPIGGGLSAVGGVDAQGYAGGRTYAWARGNMGFVYEPRREFRLGAAGFLGKDFGRYDFPADELYAKTGYALRADVAWGGFRARYMVKYDTRLKWYDREYSVNQAIGCVEAFLLYRQFPQNYQIGIRLRTGQFVNLLQRRKFERTAPPQRTVISGP